MNKLKTQKNKEINIFPSSVEDMNMIREEKRSQRLYMELIRTCKFIEAEDLWNKVIRHTFIVKELQIVF